jgi:Divergent InlB B-repeat domain
MSTTVFASHRLWLCSGLLIVLAAQAQPKLPSAPPAPSTTPFTLTVTKSGSGSGDVSSSAGGIACGDKCSNRYSPAVPVVLNARNQTGLFMGWSGACSGTQTTCTLVMDGAKTVSARFERAKLVVERSPEVKDATVTSTPAGIQCGSACGEYFNAGTSVSLFTHNLPPGMFGNFAGGSARVVMDKPMVTMRLVGTPSLRVQVAGAGKVVSQPAGIAVTAAAPQSHPFALGSTVNLRVEQGELLRWGCNAGAQANCREAGSSQCAVVVSVQSPTSCTAVFR